MGVKELNREQLIELKQHYYCQKNIAVTWSELANIDDLVTDKEIFDEYNDTIFCEEDFSFKD